MAVTYEEQVGSCKVSFSGGSVSGTRIFKVAWSDVWDFAKELKGGYRDVDGDYIEPARHPYLDYLYCLDVDVDPIITDGITETTNATGLYIVYEWAKVTAKYGILLNVADEDPETIEEESLSVAAEMLTLPSDEYEWTGDSVAIKGDVLPGKISTTTQFSVTKYHVASLPDSTVSGLVGKVNNATWRGYGAGLALFAGAEARRSITTEGTEDWELTYSFLIKAQSWNNVYRDSTGAFAAVRTRTGHDPIYESGDFTDLVPA